MEAETFNLLAFFSFYPFVVAPRWVGPLIRLLQISPHFVLDGANPSRYTIASITWTGSGPLHQTTFVHAAPHREVILVHTGRETAGWQIQGIPAPGAPETRVCVRHTREQPLQ